MAVSQEEENYKRFESLKEKFSIPESQEPAVQHKERVRPSSGGKQRRDPRGMAPPLVPLVEEGDQIQQDLYAASPVDERLTKLAQGGPNLPLSSPVKGKWKYSLHPKSNHLTTDFDAIETASVTSCSSAYSSCESSAFGPFGPGSVTELSEIGSCDTGMEYDHPPHRHYISHPLGSDDVTSEIVPKSTKAWDKAIGDWMFMGVSQPSSPSQPSMRRPSNEVRLPTPLSSPFSSTDNLLLDAGSRTSLLSFSSSTADDDLPQWTPSSHRDLPRRDPPQWTPSSYRLGKFVRSESNLATHARSTSCDQNDGNSLREGITSTSTDTQSLDNNTQQTSNKERAPNKQAEGVKSVSSSVQSSNKWEIALARYRTTPKSPVQTASKETLNEHSQSVVEARAERFGGTKGKGLRRTQSFQIGTRTTPVIKKLVIHEQ